MGWLSGVSCALGLGLSLSVAVPAGAAAAPGPAGLAAGAPSPSPGSTPLQEGDSKAAAPSPDAPPGPAAQTGAGASAGAAAAPAQASAGAPDGVPSAVAGRFNRELLEVLRQSDALGYEGRYERLRQAIAASFDLDFMAEKSLGRRWKKLSEEERRRWRDAFTQLVAATYAGRFHGYRGQHFETRAEEEGPHETVLVATRLVDPKGDDVDITYRLRRADGGWRVCDVYLEGTVSELALRRSEFASVLDREGVDALFAAVRRKIDSLEAGEAH